MTTLNTLNFDNSYITELPGDPITDNHTRQVIDACYSFVIPTKFPQASLIAYSQDLAEELGISSNEANSKPFLQLFSGSQLPSQMRSYATCYGGHQFGHWAGQLGDGRAINLTELLDQSQQRQTLQLKGAGPTPYSRSADGFAVLRSSVREFLCSEAMHHLGIPTTRALSLVASGVLVERDMFYDGNPKLEPGAIVCRVAPSFTRFGNFEIHTARNNLELLRQFSNYTIKYDFPHLYPAFGKPDTNCYINWFREVCQLTATMVVHWMRVGFVHGVMNTDNMSILGLTIDYGPYGWIDNYDPNWTPNTTDAQGKRYRFGQQAQIALWNLVQLANAIYPLIGATEPLNEALEEYKVHYEQLWRKMMANKLGFNNFIPATDEELSKQLHQNLESCEIDMTLFFRLLANLPRNTNLSELSTNELLAPFAPAMYQQKLSSQNKIKLTDWLQRYLQRLQADNKTDLLRRKQMHGVNPLYVLRNYLAQSAIDKSEQGDHSMVHELMTVLKNPYEEQEGCQHFAEKRPEWARHRAGCSMLSCSS